ncbi:MAG: hypothetical protein ACQGVK_02475 [Myxococcota bacterium]
MTQRHREPPALSPPEQRFVDRLNASFAPPPLDPARRAALDARVRERIERRRWPYGVLTAVAATSAAALASLWIGLPPGGVGPDPGAVARLDVDPWEQRLFLGDVSETGLDETGPMGSLPPEYAAIDRMFLDR